VLLPTDDPDAAPGRTARRPGQLPAGRHGLTREQVAHHQRARILRGVTEVVGRVGYAACAVEAVIGHAGVSRRTFYAHFRDRQEAFLAAYEQAVDTMAVEVAGAWAAARGDASDGRDPFAAAVTAAAAALAADQARARLVVVEVLAAGEEALARRAATVERLARALHDTPTTTTEAVVGGLHEVVLARVLAGRTHELPALVPELVALVRAVAPAPRG
jgi:AcrR family transcriptional regulator